MAGLEQHLSLRPAACHAGDPANSNSIVRQLDIFILFGHRFSRISPPPPTRRLAFLTTRALLMMLGLRWSGACAYDVNPIHGYRYCEFVDDEMYVELYEMKQDPWQMNNVA